MLATQSSRSGSLLRRYKLAQLSIHTGMIGGTATCWIAFFVCVALILQIISGYVLWWKRPKARAAV